MNWYFERTFILLASVSIATFPVGLMLNVFRGIEYYIGMIAYNLLCCCVFTSIFILSFFPKFRSRFQISIKFHIILTICFCLCFLAMLMSFYIANKCQPQYNTGNCNDPHGQGKHYIMEGYYVKKNKIIRVYILWFDNISVFDDKYRRPLE